MICDEFFWGTDYRNLYPVSSKPFPDSSSVVRIGNVGAVPCEQEIHSVNPGTGYVVGIICNPRRNNSRCQDVFSNLDNSLTDVEQRNAVKKLLPSRCHHWVTPPRLIQYDL